MNKRAAFESLTIAALGCFLITWVNEAGTLKQWHDLITFYFVTKMVSTFVLLTGMNQYFANRTYKGDSPEKIEKRVREGISELKSLPPTPMEDVLVKVTLPVEPKEVKP